jgi:hypothetical protein
MTCAHDGVRAGGLCPACVLELALDEPELAPGTMVTDRFRIVAPLGRGGMGEVYRADDLKLGHAVALKLVPASEATLREVRAGREIAHPNVCRLYDVVDVDAHAAIVMEYVDGEDLAAVLARGVPAHALQIARDVCCGLEAIHERGLVHGDLKPSNVMLDARGRARITDLGLARRAGEAQRFGGTPAYMAPEQFATRTATPLSDLYSLGLILSDLGIDHDVVQRCLRRDPSDRPASISEVLAAIAGIETPSPEYVAASEQAARLSVSQTWLFALAAIVLLALLVALYPRPRALATQMLVARARTLAGISAPVDEVWWFGSGAAFHYRSSPSPMLASRGRVTDNDPPFDLRGMRRVVLDSRGASIAVQSAPQLAAEQSPTVSQIVYVALLTLTLAAGAILAWRNLRASRVDRGGAMRVALWVFACDALAGLLVAHHPPSLDAEASMLAAIAGYAALLGAEVWVAYAALEPYARRNWPDALVSWTRLLHRSAADPLVARDLLLGVAAGTLSRLLDLPRHSQDYTESMVSARAGAGAIIHSLARGVFYALFALFLLVLLRMALRRPILAALVWLVAVTASWSLGDDVLLVAAQMLVILVVLHRLGLLAAAVTIAVHLVTLLVPLSVLPQAAIVIVLLLGTVAYACNELRPIRH